MKASMVETGLKEAVQPDTGNLHCLYTIPQLRITLSAVLPYQRYYPISGITLSAVLPYQRYNPIS